MAAAPFPAPFPETAALVVDPFTPTHRLRVSFYARGGGGAAGVAEGAALGVAQVALPPLVRVAPLEGGGAAADSAAAAAPPPLFTVLLTDPDAPSAADPKFGEFAHWVVVNAAAADVQGTGEALVAYHGSSPGPGSGVHRYCLVVYAQPGGARIACDEPRVGPTSGFPPRRLFKQRAFAAKYGLVPVAALTYTCEHDAAQPYMAAKIQGLAPPEDS
jgi:hypothetical protein